MEQDNWDAVVQIVAGILFLTPLKTMFKRVIKSLAKDRDREPFLKYHFPTLYNMFSKH